MGLVSRGRLSVQRVSQAEWDAINLLTERGGWDGLDLNKLGSSSSKAVSSSKSKSNESKVKGPEKAAKKSAKSSGKGRKRQLEGGVEEDSPEENNAGAPVPSEGEERSKPAKRSRRDKEQGAANGDGSAEPVRRSSRRTAVKATSG